MTDQELDKRPVGRPKGWTKPGGKNIPVNMLVRPDQRQKLDRLGNSKWLRSKIDKEKEV